MRENSSAVATCERATYTGSFLKDIYEKQQLYTGKTSGYSVVPIDNSYSPRLLLQTYSNPSYVKKLIDKNPQIEDILGSVGLGVNIYPDNVNQISNVHLQSTTAFALDIANKMGISYSDRKTLEKASMLHDFGKILIPPEILSKPSALTDKEKEIIDLHSELGYELLSGTNIDKRALNLIKKHHQPMSNNADILGQILSVADIYSALREERSYKTAYTPKEAIELLDQKAKQGEVSTEVVNALKAAIIDKTA